MVRRFAHVFIARAKRERIRLNDELNEQCQQFWSVAFKSTPAPLIPDVDALRDFSEAHVSKFAGVRF